jgi:catechol 2,3-dioxygenase-like lactoylglutathione lyase family enzyme
MVMLRLSFVIALSSAAVYAQVLPASSGPIRMGHLHIISANPDLQKRFWTEGLGAQYAKTEAFDLYKVPGVLVVVQKGDVRQGTEGSSVNHIAVKVRDLKTAITKCRAAGGGVVSESAQQAMLLGPDQVKVELTGDDALTSTVANHHIHFYTYDPNEMRNWYVDFFHATPGMRGRFKAADLPGVNLTFAQADTALVGTKGRSLDHIGFEVHDLEAFTKQLQAWGLTFAVPYRQVPSLGIAIAFVTDPWGTYIELTEGLDKLP